MYSITEVEQMSGISAFTLRYYDKCGFFSEIARDSRNRRQYSDDDIKRLELIEALRASGLSIEGINTFLHNLEANEKDLVAQTIEMQLTRLTLQHEQLDRASDVLQRLKFSIESSTNTNIDDVQTINLDLY